MLSRICSLQFACMFDEHGQQLECPSLPLGPAPSTEPAQVNPPLPVAPSFMRNVRPEVVVVVARLYEENGNEYLLADQRELHHEEVVASSSGGAVRGDRGARVSASSSWRRGDHLVRVCMMLLHKIGTKQIHMSYLPCFLFG
ncbi:unnamed protein product [Parnassius apollo]|uniref:(apollo) hypothetical protein n=1 Tax=Parnassius apollo TaxID=110799 RepID=A0A8S3XPK4_PARAO|nr:unnamed protein product [Parnassius apollo]